MTSTCTGWIQGLPFRIASRAPLMATGTIGAWALSAITKPPFLNGSSCPVRLRVPSGKIRKELPSRKAAAARSMAGRLWSRLPRCSGTKPAMSKARVRIGSFRNSALYRIRSRGNNGLNAEKRMGGSTLLAWLTA